MRMRSSNRFLVWAFTVLALFLSPPVYAHREDYTGTTLVFLTLERGAIEPEYFLDFGRRSEHDFLRHTVALEYGLTDHWMIDARVTAADSENESAEFGGAHFETRYRFFEEGTLPIDVAVSLEVALESEGGHRKTEIEPRLILSKDLGAFNITTNLVRLFKAHTTEGSIGFRYDTPRLIRFGSELEYDFGRDAGAILPQIWFALPREVTLKFAHSTPFGGGGERFFRLVLEVEF